MMARHLKPPETLLITHGILLNFWLAPFWLPHPLTDELFCYPGVEWRFQAYKGLFIGQSRRIQCKTHDAIAKAKTAREAKNMGRGVIGLNVPKWNKYSYSVMLMANLAKFTQDPKAKTALKATGDAHLVEHRPDKVWGDNLDGSGQNLQGIILEKVRAVL